MIVLLAGITATGCRRDGRIEQLEQGMGVTFDFDDIARFKHPVLQPARLPPDLHLTDARVLAAEETAEDCDQVELAYGRGLADEAVKVYSLPRSCFGRVAEPVGEKRSLEVSGLSGSALATEHSGAGLVAATVSDERRAVVVVNWYLPLAELDVVLSDLAPFDPKRVTGAAEREAWLRANRYAR